MPTLEELHHSFWERDRFIRDNIDKIKWKCSKCGYTFFPEKSDWKASEIVCKCSKETESTTFQY